MSDVEPGGHGSWRLVALGLLCLVALVGLVIAYLTPPPGSPTNILVRPRDVPVPAALRHSILARSSDSDAPCAGPGECLLFWKPGEAVAVTLLDGCAASIVGRENQTRSGVTCRIRPSVLKQAGKDWEILWSIPPADKASVVRDPSISVAEEERMLKRERDAIDRGDVEVREIEGRRKLFIGDDAVGVPLD